MTSTTLHADSAFSTASVVCAATKRETPPPIEFIKLSDLLAAIQAEEMETPDPDAETQREGLSLLGLVATADVAATEAAAERVEGLAALYIPEDKRVIMIEDPGGVEPSEEDLGLPVPVFNMSVLAHEYVHAYQDREYDLVQFQKQIPDNFDGQLASISSVEGEAALYEYEFLFDVMNRQDADRQSWFEALVDAAEEALAESDSPWLAARGIFPYTYGAHSAWKLTDTDGPEALEGLRQATTTRSYIERRFGALEPNRTPGAEVSTATDAGLDQVVHDDLGAWLVNGFVSRALQATTETALYAAREWSADQVSVWRGPEDEVLIQWVVGYTPSEATTDAGAGGTWSWPTQAQVLAANDPPSDGAWLVSDRNGTWIVTASTDANSTALPRLHQTNTLSPNDGDVTPLDADAGLALPSFTYQRTGLPALNQSPTMASRTKRARAENVTRRRLLHAVPLR